jgi:multisubunit Na+/H+ antiporter MnhE subunit
MPILARAASWLTRWAVLAALWLLLVDTTKLPELCTGAVAAALAATAAELVGEQRKEALRPRVRWLRRLPYAVLQVPLDSVRLTAALVRLLRGGPRPQGSFRAVRWRAEERRADSAAREVAAKALDSLGPNSYVVGIDSERELMLVHQLLPGPDAASADPMELR